MRVIDALAVYKDAAGDIEVMHLSNLTKDEAKELGSKVAALIGLGIDGDAGMEAGAVAGAQAAEDGVEVFDDDDAWDVIEEIPNDSASRADPARTPLGGAVARRDRPRRGLQDLRRIHQPARPGRHRPAGARRDRRARARKPASPARHPHLTAHTRSTP